MGDLTWGQRRRRDSQAIETWSQDGARNGLMCEKNGCLIVRAIGLGSCVDNGYCVSRRALWPTLRQSCVMQGCASIEQCTCGSFYSCMYVENLSMALCFRHIYPWCQWPNLLRTILETQARILFVIFKRRPNGLGWPCLALAYNVNIRVVFYSDVLYMYHRENAMSFYKAYVLCLCCVYMC